MPFLWIEIIDALFYDFGKPLAKALRHLKPDEILLLLSLDPSKSSLQGIKSLKNSTGIPSGPQALKLGVEEIALIISSSLMPWLISHSYCLGLPKFFSASESFQ